MWFKRFLKVHYFFIIMEALWNIPPREPDPSVANFGKPFLVGITRLGNPDDINSRDNLHGRLFKGPV
jgi:hypothetical protein